MRLSCVFIIKLLLTYLLPSSRGCWQQTAGCTQAEVVWCNNWLAPPVWLQCQRCSKGVQLLHMSHMSRAQSALRWPRPCSCKQCRWIHITLHCNATPPVSPAPPTTFCKRHGTTWESWPELCVSAAVKPMPDQFSGHSTPLPAKQRVM